MNWTVPVAVPAEGVTVEARLTVFTPPVAVREVVVVLATMVEVTIDDWEVVKSALSVGTNVARYGWSPLTRSDSTTEAVPEATAWVPTSTPLSRNSTLPAGVPAGAVTVAVRVADRPVTTDASVVVVTAAGGGAVPAQLRLNAPTPVAKVR